MAHHHLRRNRIQLEDIDSLPLEDEKSVADEVEKKFQYEQIMKALETLPSEQALAIKLKYVEDMTLAQIAERFGVQQKTIKSRIHDGTVKLRKMLNLKERGGGYMNSNVDRMISNLTPAIEEKCEELQTARKERLQSCLFVLLCAIVVLIPALLVFAGISLTVLIAPLAFMALSVLLLLPVLLSGKAGNKGGGIYEQT